jgi:DNA polymerase I-like protein with 3'-5' exonuclease and polymerase domains
LSGKLNLVLAVHDELIAEVDEDDAEYAADLIKAAMIESGERYLKKVPCLVDVHIEESWKK